MFYGIYNSPFYPIMIVGNEEGITHIHLMTNTGKDLERLDEWKRNDDFFKEAMDQLKTYFEGSRQEFDLKLNPKGTDFQKKVWEALSRIPYGQVCSYRDIAESIGNVKACRAVGMANGKNPIAIVVPCHRVIGSNGKLIGYAGGLDTKKELLRLEGFLKD